MRNVPTQERSRRTLDAIMVAADQLFFKHGVDASTLTEIADAAEVSIGALYRFFPNKDALVDEYLNRYLDALATEISEPLPESPTIDQLEELIDRLLDRGAIVRRRFVGYGNVRVWRRSDGSRPAQIVTDTEFALIRGLFNSSIYEMDPRQIERMTQVIVLSSYPILELLPSVSRTEGNAMVDEIKVMLDAYIRHQLDVTKLKKT